MEKRLDPETSVNKLFENVFMSGTYSEFFSGRGHQFSSLFSSVVLSTDLILSNLSTVPKTTPGGSGGMLQRNGHFSAF